MGKIQHLTPEQEASIPLYRAQWIALGESTARGKPEEMVDAVNGLFDALGGKRRPVFVMDSPLGCIVAANWLKANIGANIRANIWANIRANIWANIEANIEANIRANIWANIEANIEANIRANIWANIRANIEANIRANIPHESAAEWGNHNISWLAYVSFFETIGHSYPLPLTSKLKALRHYHETCGWLYVFEGMAFVSQRPTVLRRDDSGRLHSETGNAVEFADGYGFCAWHGTQVPAHWVAHSKTVAPTEILSARNVEQRAAGCDIVGWARMLDHLPHKVVDSSLDPLVGDLLEVSLPGFPESELYLKFECPRNGTMMEAVNKRQLKKPDLHHAHAWHAGIPPSIFSYAQQRS